MDVIWSDRKLAKTGIHIIQINLGDKCNQQCTHCHIGASPHGKRNMDAAVAENILSKLLDMNTGTIEFTGGAPELNPNLERFLTELGKNGRAMAVRTNLTALAIPEYSHYIDLYSRFRVKVIASLPGCFRDSTDRQRGKGVFDSSIEVLRKLNRIGYGAEPLDLELVYNPQGEYLPPAQEDLEVEYRKLLKEGYGIVFNRLITITNSPIGGFRRYLEHTDKYDEYMQLLVNNFNPATLEHIMCRRLLSIDYEGYMYDCDFNLALGIRVKGYENVRFWEVDFDAFSPEITCGDHCYACTVRRGSSCHGILVNDHAPFDTRETVKQYYGVELRGTADLKTGACCVADPPPPHIREILPYIAEEIKERYYGCGSPFPLVLRGLRALDLGCGTGRDCYLLSKLVGEEGFVYGIDMTETQIAIAKKYQNIQAERFRYGASNVLFIHDYLENLAAHFPEESLELVVSNCVVNLVEDKESLLRQIYAILKNGGEFYFSDIYADRRLPEHLRRHALLYGECLGGALYWRDFERISKKAGFADPRVVSRRVVDISNPEILELVGNITFFSITYRLWKIDGIEDACEDYGHIACYRGGIPEAPFVLQLDAEHTFEKDKPERVCGNTALMLSKTRFAPFVEVIGTFSQHFGSFDRCGTGRSQRTEAKQNTNACSCR